MSPFNRVGGLGGGGLGGNGLGGIGTFPTGGVIPGGGGGAGVGYYNPPSFTPNLSTRYRKPSIVRT